jgi:hypothetical protein
MDGVGSVEFLFGDFRLDPSIPSLHQVDKTGKQAEKLVVLSHNADVLLRLLVEGKGQVSRKRKYLQRFSM